MTKLDLTSIFPLFSQHYPDFSLFFLTFLDPLLPYGWQVGLLYGQLGIIGLLGCCGHLSLCGLLALHYQDDVSGWPASQPYSSLLYSVWSCDVHSLCFSIP